MPFSLENICRTCMCNGADDNKECYTLNKKAKLTTSQMFSLNTIHKDVSQDTVLMNILRATNPQLKIEPDDKLPKNICVQCLSKIKELHRFQQNCIEVEKRLYKIFEIRDADREFSSAFVSNEYNKSIKLDIDDVFIDNSSFTSEEFIDEDDSKDCLEAVSDMDDFIESCSDMSIDFVLDDESVGDCSVSEAAQATKNCSTSGRDLTAQELFSCAVCTKLLKSEVTLKKHMKTHSKKDAEESKCVCHICDRAFTQAYMLRDHLRSHSGEKPYLCSECGKSFTTSSSLKQHLLRHQSEKQFACPECPKTFPTRTDLSSHYDVHKARPKNHICDVCGRGFPKAFILKKHKMAHTSERPYPCEFCEKRFLTNEKLQRHTRIHTGEKPYKCKYCDRAYCQSNELTKHLRCHLGENVYQCRLCPERYPTAKNVKEHFKDHKHDDEETRARNLAKLEAMEIKGIFCR